MNRLIEFINKHKTNTGWRKWLIGGFVVLAIIAAVSVYFIRSFMAARELAALKHERDVAHERARQAATDAVLATNGAERQRQLTVASDALAVVQVTELRIAEISNSYDENKKIIDSITNWEDVDAKVR